jgi:hypothetical protein
MGTLDFDNLQSESLEEVGKYFQRLAAVGFLPRTHEVINKGLSSLGVDPISEDTNLDEILTSSISRSGDGMKEGLSSGTGSAAGASGDASVSNLDNV